MGGGSGGSGSGGRSGGGDPTKVLQVVTVAQESERFPGSFVGETSFMQRGTGEWTSMIPGMNAGGPAPKLVPDMWHPTLKAAMINEFGEKRATRYKEIKK